MPPRRTSPHAQSRRTRDGAVAVGGVARRARQARGWTLQYAAAQMGLELRQLQKLEAGEGNPQLGTLLRVADGLGVLVSELVGGVRAGEGAKSYAAALTEVKIEAGVAAGVREGELLGVVGEGDVVQRLAERVKRLRAERGWSQEALAKAAGVSPQYLQRIELGRVNPSVRVVERVLRALGDEFSAL